MAIVRIGRGETASVDYRDGKLSKRFTQPLTVELEDSDPPYTAGEIIYLPGVPRPGLTTYRPRPGVVIPFAICRSIKPKFRSMRLWDLTAEYEQGGEDEPTEEGEDPSPFINLSPTFEPFTEKIEVPIYKDFDGTEIVDPLGDLFETPTLATIPLPGVRVTRYVMSFDETTLASWECCTNSAPWRGQPADAWWIKSAVGRVVDVAGYTLGQLTFEILSNPLELTIGGTTRRVGWMDARKLESEDYKTAGKRHTNRNHVGTIRRTKITPTGEKTTETHYAVFRKFRQRDFAAIA